MSKRIEWIDVAKGLGIILVIYGHVSFRPEFWNVWLCSFHMPLFFFLSGVTVKIDKMGDFKTFITKKIKTLVMPYLLFVTINWLWKITWELLMYLYNGSEINFVYLIKQAMGIFVQIRTTDYGPGIWFIPCIFITYLMFWGIVKCCKQNKQLTIILAVISLMVGYFYCTYIDIKLPWGIDAAFIAVFFMISGNLCAPYLPKNEDGEKIFWGGCKKTVVACITGVSLIGTIVFAYLNFCELHRTVGMWSNNYGNIVYFLASAIMGIVFISVVANLIYWKALIYIGENSIFYYGLHVIFVEILTIFAGRIPGLESDTVAFVVSTVVVVVTLIVLRLICPIYKYIYNNAINLKR